MLYHKCIYWKNDFNKQCMNIIRYNKFELSNHLKNNQHNLNLKAIISIICRIRNGKQYGVFFEAEEIDNRICKFALRTTYNKYKDITIVLSNKGKVVTAWLNNKDDLHYTLIESKYCIG